MPNMNIRNVPGGIMRAAKVAAAAHGMTLREYIIGLIDNATLMPPERVERDAPSEVEA